MRIKPYRVPHARAQVVEVINIHEFLSSLIYGTIEIMLHHRGCVKVVVWLDVAAQRQGVIVRVNSRAKKFGRFGLVLDNPRFELTEVRARRCFYLRVARSVQRLESVALRSRRAKNFIFAR